jgi:ankyrin repeat protein
MNTYNLAAETATETADTTNKVNVTHYTEFVPKNELTQFEIDMEEGEYNDWIQMYPQHLLSIFGAFLEFGGNFVTEADILNFKNEGVDFNVITNAYPHEDGFTTALIFACEHRNKQLIELLILHGADVNKKDYTKMSPLESTLIGHSMLYLGEIEETETCVKLLLESGAKSEIRKYILKDCCEEYLEKSEYLKSVLDNVKLLE